MPNKLKIILPDIEQYRKILLNKGIKYPLNSIEVPKTGLLNKLPNVSIAKSGWPWTKETDPAIYDDKISWPKLTIVTPSYNQGEFIEETIRSVLLQNYPNLEYIIIDGGSTDNTINILEKYSPWISYWQSEKDRGQGNAINLGFSLASGGYRAWINSDDYYLRDTFCKVIKTFKRHEVSFVYGYALNFDIYTKKFQLIKVLPLFDYLIRLPNLAQPSCFWDAKIHRPIWEELHCSLDYELWLRMVKGQRRKLLREPLSVANMHENAKTFDPKMNMAWKHDHELICSAEAYGPVNNWDRIVFLRKAQHYFDKIFEKLIPSA